LILRFVDEGFVEGFDEGLVDEGFDEGFVEGFVDEGFVEGFVEGSKRWISMDQHGFALKEQGFVEAGHRTPEDSHRFHN
jgi:hypothetical protein